MRYSDPQEVLKFWLDAVNGGDLDAICHLYCDDAVLVPTFSDIFRTTPKSRRDYFAMLSNRPGLKVEIDESSLTIQKVGSSLYVTGGIYEWCHDTEQGRVRIPARFSYVVDLNQAGPIVHHHSSTSPAT